MFSILNENKNGLEVVKLLSNSTGEYVSIVPSFGANVNELLLLKNGKHYNLLAGNTSIESFKEKGIYNSAKLFPFPNRIKDGTYNFKGRKYTLPINYPEENNACHGFVYDKLFKMVDSQITSNYISATFKYEYNGTIKGFPFPFNIELKYILNIYEGFTCETKVSNQSELPFPMGDGWHPFISLNSNIDNLLLKFLADEEIEIDNKFIPTGIRKRHTKFNKPNKIGNTNFDTCFNLKSNSDIHYTEIFNDEEDLTVCLWQEVGVKKYNYLQIYTPPGRNSIAVEPMTCNINGFNNGEGLIILEPNEMFTSSYGIKIS